MNALLLLLLVGALRSKRPKEGDSFLVRDARDKSVRLRFQRAGAGFAWVPEPGAVFEPSSSFQHLGSHWDFFPGLNAFVERASGAPAPKVQKKKVAGVLAPEQGNRWHAIRYRWSGGAQRWGTPFWGDFGSARELTPLGSELWAWVGGAWKKLW